VTLHLTNTLTRRKEPFVPRDEGKVGMYLCGPTVYSEPHIGNLRNVVLFDVLRRHLEASGYEVTYVRNYTDVDDKIIKASGDDPLNGYKLAEHWIRVYEDITGALGVRPPDVAPRATGHIPEMLALVAALLDNGLAYEAGGDVYFSVGKYPDYGKLSHRDTAELRAGERVEINPDKRDPLDFALWKGAKPGEPRWEAPWGAGRPGWHLECSAMSAKYLGPGFDIHGGGEDLVFPHHENEVAQSEGATGKPFARVWLHNAFLTTGGEKMAKSVGNVTSPRELLKHYDGMVLRYALLSAHYRSPLEFTSGLVEDDAERPVASSTLDDAAAAYDRLATFAVNAAKAVGEAEPDDSEDTFTPRFVAALDDDLNIPAAFAVLFDLVGETNPLIAKAERGDAGAAAGLRARLDTFVTLAGRLGFFPLDELPPAALGPGLLDLVLQLRQRARKAKDFEAADLVRTRLTELGVRVEDRANGSRWHLGRGAGSA
jgi:cysteinyl-tRNA synthetase